jgi:hypothetical protein
MFIFGPYKFKKQNKMKKLFLFMAATALTISLSSCSKDSGGGGNSMSMKINGVNKTFKTEGYSFQGTTGVYGYIGDDAENPTDVITFDLASGTGDKITGFTYSNNTTYFSGTFTSDVTENSSSYAKGTFSGTLEPVTGTDNVEITEGTFSTNIIAQ